MTPYGHLSSFCPAAGAAIQARMQRTPSSQQCLAAAGEPAAPNVALAGGGEGNKAIHRFVTALAFGPGGSVLALTHSVAALETPFAGALDPTIECADPAGTDSVTPRAMPHRILAVEAPAAVVCKLKYPRAHACSTHLDEWRTSHADPGYRCRLVERCGQHERVRQPCRPAVRGRAGRHGSGDDQPRHGVDDQLQRLYGFASGLLLLTPGERHGSRGLGHGCTHR